MTPNIAANIAIATPNIAKRIPPPIPGPTYAWTFDEIEKLIKISLQDYKDYYNSKKKKLIKNKFAK